MKKNSADYKLPESQYIRQSQLIPFIVPFSAATLWRKVSEKTFPKPHKLSARITAWKTTDVQEWLDSKTLVVKEEE